MIRNRSKRNVSLRVTLAALLLVVGACDDRDASDSTQQEQTPPPQNVPFQLGDDADGVLYTWVDEGGRFRIAEQQAAIPEASRGLVRVVVDGKPTGTPEYVYVADLSKSQSGNVELRAMSRDEWESQGREAREQALAQLAPKPAPDTDEGSLGVDAVVYGADWCKPCHQAEDYLKKKGVTVDMKNIEQDPKAAREMQSRLSKAGLHGASIPVVHVAGTTMVGFNPRAIDAALARAR